MHGEGERGARNSQRGKQIRVLRSDGSISRQAPAIMEAARVCANNLKVWDTTARVPPIQKMVTLICPVFFYIEELTHRYNIGAVRDTELLLLLLERRRGKIVPAEFPHEFIPN